jgi:protein-tyrosine-phosphatase
MPSILFVCTANRLRSPLAAAMFRKKLGELGVAEAWQIDSAGIWAAPGQRALPEAVKAAANVGLELASHRSVRVSRESLFDYDLIVAMTAGQKEALLTEFPRLQDSVYLLSDIVERRGYDIPDAAGSEQELKGLFVLLDGLLRRGLQAICVLATYLHNTKRIQSQREG